MVRRGSIALASLAFGLACVGGIEPVAYSRGHGDASWEADPLGKGPGVRVHFVPDDERFTFTGRYVVRNGVASHSRVVADSAEFVITPDPGTTFAVIELDSSWVNQPVNRPAMVVVQFPDDWSVEGPVLLTHAEPW